MTDISRIKTLHDLRSTFAVDDADMERFYAQIKTEAVTSNAERFYKGFSIETDFRIIFSALPWVKLIHGLDQEQLPSDSKKEFQVPDFILHFEAHDFSRIPILVEVKSVTGLTESLQLGKKQVEASLHYANIMGLPLLYAIYWERFKTWTLNTIENFEPKQSKFKINMHTAYMNNLSMLFDDVCFFNDKPIFRKVIYDDESSDPDRERHQIHGFVRSRSISIDDVVYEDLEVLDSSIINSAIPMERVELIKEAGTIVLKEKSRGIKFMKVSDEITRYLATFFGKPEEQLARMSCYLLFTLCRRLGMSELYMVPKVRTKTSDLLFTKAFARDWLDANYFSERS